MEHDIHFLRICRGVSGRWAMWAIANPVFGRIEGAPGQWWRAALVLAHPVLGSQFRHCSALILGQQIRVRPYGGFSVTRFDYTGA